MGYEHFASRYDTIAEKQIEKVCPDEWAIFSRCVEKVCDKLDCSAAYVLELFARHEDDEEKDEYAEIGQDNQLALRQALVRLQDAFGGETQLGLNLHWISEGLRGSDVAEEVVWVVAGAWGLTPEARAFEAKHGKIRQQWHMDGG